MWKIGLTLLGDIVGSWAKRKAAEQKSRQVIAEKQAENEANWEAQWARNANSGWLDEFYGVLLAIPIVLVFFGPEWAARVKNGFIALSESVPAWYITAWLAAVSAAFGLRGVSRWQNGKRGKDE